MTPQYPAIRAYVATWTLQKLFDVLAFAEDGRMSAFAPCRCIVAAGASSVLHGDCVMTCNSGARAYLAEKESIPAAVAAEQEYSRIGPQPARDRVLIAILREEIERRDHEAALAVAEAEGMVCA